MLDMIHSDGAQPRNDNRWTMLYPELIYEILTYCLSDTTLDTFIPKRFPWYLGHICRSWRSVFTSSPRFWDRFTFIAERFVTHHLDSERASTLVELCIKRTKDQPFSFRFNAKPKDYLAASYMYRAMKTIVAHADRWSVAYVKVKGFGGPVADLLLKNKHRFGQLHTLQISIPRVGTSSRLHHPSLFEYAPNLTHVYTTDYYRLRWSSLTVLHIGFSSYPSIRMLFAEFDKMTCLEELVIRGAPRREENTVAMFQTPVKLPSLKILYVKHYYPLSFITAPSLEILHLGDILPVLQGTPIETLLRGVSHLRTLSFNVNICDVLHCIPELDHAIVIGKHFVLALLVYQPMARSLKTITISDADVYESGTKALCNITSVVQRWEKHQFPNLRLLSVFLHERKDEDMSPAIYDLLQLGTNKGFEVDIKFSPPQIIPRFRDL